MNLGLDIDGTITDDPIFFARICREVLRGGEVHIVSSRSQEALQETIKELAELGITYTTVHLLARMSEAQIICPHAGLDWYQRHQWLKVDYSLTNGLTHFVDDDPKVLSLFNRFAPSIVAIDVNSREILLKYRR
jgi:hypothetical protein